MKLVTCARTGTFRNSIFSHVTQAGKKESDSDEDDKDNKKAESAKQNDDDDDDDDGLDDLSSGTDSGSTGSRRIFGMCLLK